MSVVIAGYARTPFTKFTGKLATESAAKLGATKAATASAVAAAINVLNSFMSRPLVSIIAGRSA